MLPRVLEVLKEGTRPQGGEERSRMMSHKKRGFPLYSHYHSNHRLIPWKGAELLEDFGLPTFLEALLKALVRGEAGS